MYWDRKLWIILFLRRYHSYGCSSKNTAYEILYSTRNSTYRVRRKCLIIFNREFDIDCWSLWKFSQCHNLKDIKRIYISVRRYSLYTLPCNISRFKRCFILECGEIKWFIYFINAIKTCNWPTSWCSSTWGISNASHPNVYYLISGN